MWEAGRVYLPEGKPWAQDVLRQLTRFPLGTLDDKVDTCAIFGQMINKVWSQSVPEPVKEPDVAEKYGDGPYRDGNKLIMPAAVFTPKGNDPWL